MRIAKSLPVLMQCTKIYRLTELVGKWSMVDVYVVAILVALIQLGGLLTILPGPAALAFAGVVARKLGWNLRVWTIRRSRPPELPV